MFAKRLLLILLLMCVIVDLGYCAKKDKSARKKNKKNKNKKKVHGGYSEYSDWSVCSAPCGGGEQNQTRTCTDPAPANGGKDCAGKANKSQACNKDPCPGVYNVVDANGERGYWDRKGKIYKWSDHKDNPMSSPYFRSLYTDLYDRFTDGETTNWDNYVDADAYLDTVMKFVDIGCAMAWTTEMEIQSTIFVAYADTKEGRDVPPILNDWGCTLEMCRDATHSWFGFEPAITTGEYLDAEKPSPLAALQDAFLAQFQGAEAALGFEKARSATCDSFTFEATRLSLELHVLEAEKDFKRVENPGSLGPLEGKIYVGASADLTTARIMNKVLEKLCYQR